MTKDEIEFAEAKKRRPHHRPIMLTVSKMVYDFLRGHGGDRREIYSSCANDIIRTSRCGQENVHHWERRVETVMHAISGGFRKVNVRWCGDCTPVKAEVVGVDTHAVDDAAFIVTLRRAS